MSVLSPKEFDAIVPPTCSITPLSRGEANRLRISDAALRAIIQRAVEDVEKMGHGANCCATPTDYCKRCRMEDCGASCQADAYGPTGPCNCGHDAAIARLKKGLGEK